MTPGRASETARFVAIHRAYHHLFAPEPKLLRDDLALAISGLPDAEAVKAAMGGLIDGFAQLGGPDVAAAFMQQVEHSVCARSGLVEHRLEALKATDLSQLVILGAGLDTLAYRRADLLGNLTVFEVDHPDTQAFKRQALEQAGIAIPDNVTFVPFDFENVTLADAMAAGGIAKDQQSFFTWLGVNMYLTDAAVRSTMRAVTDFAAGSEVIMDFMPTESVELEDSVEDSITALRNVVENMGEAIESRFSKDDLEALLRDCGFGMVDFINGRDIRDRLLGGAENAFAMPDEAVSTVLATVTDPAT